MSGLETNPNMTTETALNANPNAAPQQRALIYCRISDAGQTGLGSQEHRCRQHAAEKGYEVARVFHDKVTGGGDFSKREGMMALLDYIDARPGERFVLIFDDLRRYGRDTEFYLLLRRLMQERGVRRECLNFTFEDTPEGLFNETINAAVAQLEREANYRQSRQKTIARLEAGYAVYSRPPIGYTFIKQRPGNNKILARDEPLASVIQTALEGFASGRFSTQAEVGRWLEAHPDYPHKTVRVQRVTDILTQPLYAGYVGSKQLGVSLREGRHPPLISKATFETIKDRIEGRANAPARKDLNRDFVLRGAVACGCCGSMLTASWSKGVKKHHPYYLCQNRGCDLYGKSIRRADIEGRFDALLKTIQPAASLIKVTTTMVRTYWERKGREAKRHAKAIKAELKQAEAQIDKLVDRIVKTTNERVIGALESKIDDLEREKLILREQAANLAAPPPAFDGALERALTFLANPYKIWTCGSYDVRRLVLRLVFPEPLSYHRELGYRTAEISIPFKLLGEISGGNSPEMKDGGGKRRNLEPEPRG
ncbi:MAG: recombinase family protein [Maricaulaceae bacterium]